jgi:hypothetical protein
VLVTFTVTTGAGTVSPPSSETNGDGVAATSFACASPAGPSHNAVQATFDGLQGTPASWSLTANPGALALVDFRPGPIPDSIPVAAGSGQPLALAGILRDGFGASPPVTVTWEVISGGGSLASSSTPAIRCPGEVMPTGLDDWCAANTWTLGSAEPGLQVIRLSSPDSPGFEQQFHARVVPGPLLITQAPPSPLIGEAGSTLPLPLEVRVLAADGSPLPRVLVRFRGDGQIQPADPQDTAATSLQVYTHDDGRAVMSYTFGTSIYHSPFRSFFYVEATVTQIDAVNPPSSTPFWEVTVLPGPVAQLAIAAGNDQAGTVDHPLGLPLQVRVTDQFTNGVEGQTVTWTVTSGGGSLAAPTSLTDGNGLTDNLWTLGPTPGTQTVSATIGTLSVTFSAAASSGG